MSKKRILLNVALRVSAVLLAALLLGLAPAHALTAVILEICTGLCKGANQCRKNGFCLTVFWC